MNKKMPSSKVEFKYLTMIDLYSFSHIVMMYFTCLCLKSDMFYNVRNSFLNYWNTEICKLLIRQAADIVIAFDKFIVIYFAYKTK
jgi:hypothetical protein